MTLPRSALLTAWGAAVAAGRVAAADAVRAVGGQDEPHTLVGQDDWMAPVELPVPEPGYLSDLMVLLAAAGERRPLQVRCVLPAPGDVLGVPGPPALVGAAAEAGECVVLQGLLGPDGPEAVGLVPEVEAFGSADDTGHQVTWRLWRASTAPVPSVVGSLAEADMTLRVALRDATTALERLDVASWRDDVVSGLRSTADTGHVRLPRTVDARAVRVATSAERVLDIVGAAALDHGGTVSGWESAKRADALGGVARAARAALAAAVSLPG